MKDEKVTVLHLSDLHFSNNINEDIDLKSSLKLNTKSEKLDQFKEYIINLPKKPDFVVVSGDLTKKGNAKGFEIFNSIIIDLIKKDKLPPVDKFVIVPGNHDVRAGDSFTDSNRWVDFKEIIGKRYLIPWIVGSDSSYDDMTKMIDESLERKDSLMGGIVHNPITREISSLPFLLDKEHKTIFYAFNSSLLSHTKVDDDKTAEMLAYIKRYRSNEKDLMDLAAKCEAEMQIDPARIIGDEIKLFGYCMRKLGEVLGDEYSEYLKIAVLHHHVAPISGVEEVKKFELLLNAGSFKRTLVEYEFNVVLHGHKHWNEVYWDTAIPNGGALLVISGGTICDIPAKNKKQGFYLLDFHTNSKIVEANYYELEQSYSKVKSITNKQIYSYDTNNKYIGKVEVKEQFDIEKLYSRVKNTLLDSINQITFGGQTLFGWSRLINVPNKVGMIATADGLIIANLLRINDVSFLKVKDQIVDSLWKFRLSDGGFSAISQTDTPSIEATVWAVRAFYYTGDYLKFETAMNDLISMCETQCLNENSSITTLSLVLDLLCECNFKIDLIEHVKNCIIQKAKCENGNIVYWDNSVNGIPCSTYTILAAISLMNYAKLKKSQDEMIHILRKCGEWIESEKWENMEEIISKPISITKEDRLVYQHFTLPLGIIALLKLGYSTENQRLKDEMNSLLNKEKNGLWSWNESYDYPIWAIYNALSAINEYSMKNILL